MIRRAFEAFARRRIATGLDGLHVDGLDRARRALEAGPVVFAANHVAWWDGLLLLPIDTALGGGGRVWMDARNLARLPFFARLGAVPVHPGQPGRLRADLRWAEGWLSGPGRSLWVFPQGRQRPSWLRPLELSRGAEVVAARSGATVVPVGVAYPFREAPVPAAFVAFGEPGGGVEDGIVAALDRVDRHLAGGDLPFDPLVPSRARRPDQGLATRLLSWMVRRG